MIKRLISLLLLVGLAVVGWAFASRVPLPEATTAKVCMLAQPSPDTMLAKAISHQIDAQRGLNGVYPLVDGHDAFAARLALARAAERTLDVQYYIWHHDTAGYLLAQALRDAADRGVQVRLLLDDNNTRGMDSLLVALNAHPSIEVRLFNPFMRRSQRVLDYITDFRRLNRRMHNKSFSADGVVSIVGGRNIGDEYFGVGTGLMFADLDVATVGPVVHVVESDFNRYWHSASSYPAEWIIPAHTAAEAIAVKPRSDATTQAYLVALAHSDLAQNLAQANLPLWWASASLLSDNPGKGLGQVPPQGTVLAHMLPVLAQAKQDITIVSPYFVPTRQGTDALVAATQKGVKVTVLTNSLAATDVGAVHSGYVRYRRDLLKAGVNVYELKPNATVTAIGGGGLSGSSGASLHAKTFAVDGRHFFVGSFNMDPRSAALNTEMGLLYDSPELSAQLATALSTHLPEHAYHVRLDEAGKLYWTSQEQGQQVVYHQEPESTWLRRTLVVLMGYLPIEWLL